VQIVSQSKDPISDRIAMVMVVKEPRVELAVTQG
jgi:hypothetical protein